MISDAGHLAAGERALAAADWKGATEAFEAALAEARSAEALSGLGYAMFWLGDLPRALGLRLETRAAAAAYAAKRGRKKQCTK